MFYENELRFLCDTFKKCHVQIATVSPDGPLDGIIDTELDSLFGRISGQTTIHGYLGDLAPRTMYKLVGPFKLSYTYLLLPETEADTVLLQSKENHLLCRWKIRAYSEGKSGQRKSSLIR